MNGIIKYLTAVALVVSPLLPGAAGLAQASNAARNTAAIYVPCQKQVRAANTACTSQARSGAQSAVQLRTALRACSKARRQRLAVCRLRANAGGYAGIVTNAHFGAASW